MTLSDFGRALLETADLDPLYVVLYAAQLDDIRLGRFILAYSMVYHAGASAWAAEHKDFWPAMEHLMLKGPRGTERRHWRADLARNTLERLKMSKPEDVLWHWFRGRGDSDYFERDGRVSTFADVFRRVQMWPGYGQWIAFKIADTAERVNYATVTDWRASALHIYSEPRKGAALYRYGDQDHYMSNDELSDIVNSLVYDFREFKAPPLYDRAVNVQEVETILCKWKSHMNGRYPVGKDTKEILHHLNSGWGELAEHIAACPLL